MLPLSFLTVNWASNYSFISYSRGSGCRGQVAHRCIRHFATNISARGVLLRSPGGRATYLSPHKGRGNLSASWVDTPLTSTQRLNSEDGCSSSGCVSPRYSATMLGRGCCLPRTRAIGACLRVFIFCFFFCLFLCVVFFFSVASLLSSFCVPP